MTSPYLQALAELVDDHAGGYLDGIDRSVADLREFCATPVAAGHDYRLCLPCSDMTRHRAPTADRLGALVYAVMPGSQTYRLVRDYKSQNPGPSFRPIFSSLLALGLRGHLRCLGLVTGVRADAWAVVPSSRGRTVLRDLVVRVLNDPALPEVPVQFAGRVGERQFAPDHWHVRMNRPMRHVILVDDAWVRGAHAQSVASALKTSGAQQVSVFAVARVLSSTWPASKPMVEKLRGGTFDWTRYPWTGGACPADPPAVDWVTAHH